GMSGALSELKGCVAPAATAINNTISRCNRHMSAAMGIAILLKKKGVQDIQQVTVQSDRVTGWSEIVEIQKPIKHRDFKGPFADQHFILNLANGVPIRSIVERQPDTVGTHDPVCDNC